MPRAASRARGRDVAIRARPAPYKHKHPRVHLDDPQGDVDIQTSEGHQFKCQSFDLISCSSVFKELLSAPRPPTLIIPESCDVFYSFLHLTKLGTYDSTHFETLHQGTAQVELQLFNDVLEMCDHYQAHRLESALEGGAEGLAVFVPWEVLKLASKRGWKKAAARAIAWLGCLEVRKTPAGVNLGGMKCSLNLHPCNYPNGITFVKEMTFDPLQLSMEAAADLGFPLYHALCRAARAGLVKGSDSIYGMSSTARWKLIAEAFEIPNGM